MDREFLIRKAVLSLSKLPTQKIQEITDFAEFLISKTEDEGLVDDIQKLMAVSTTFDFLNHEPELYSIADIKKK